MLEQPELIDLRKWCFQTVLAAGATAWEPEIFDMASKLEARLLRDEAPK